MLRQGIIVLKAERGNPRKTSSTACMELISNPTAWRCILNNICTNRCFSTIQIYKHQQLKAIFNYNSQYVTPGMSLVVVGKRVYNNNNNNNNNNNSNKLQLGCHPVAVVILHVHKYEKKKVTRKLKSGGLHEKHVVATWKRGNHPSIRLQTQGNQEKPVSRWPVTGPSGY